jgi:hypothetical protein
MVDLQTLFQTVDELTADELKQLYLYIMQTRVQFVAAPEETPSKSRALGLFENVGETWMSDDFDAELPDSFWLGEEQS